TSHAIFYSDDQSWSFVLFSESPCHDSDNAVIPILAPHNNRRLFTEPQFGNFRIRFFFHAPLLGPPHLTQMLHLDSELTSAFWIFFAEQTKRGIGGLQAARRIEPGGNAKGNIRRCKRHAAINRYQIKQRSQP